MHRRGRDRRLPVPGVHHPQQRAGAEELGLAEPLRRRRPERWWHLSPRLSLIYRAIYLEKGGFLAKPLAVSSFDMAC